MSSLEFTEAVAQRLEAVYMTPDVVEQRCRTLRAMNLRPGGRVVIQFVADFAAANANVGPEVAEAWKADLEHLGERGEFFYSLNRYLFVAQRPA